TAVKAEQQRLGTYYFYFQKPSDALYTDNETNLEKVVWTPNKTPFVKDAFHNAIIKGKNVEVLRERKKGTKFSPVYNMTIEAGETKVIYCRLCKQVLENPFAGGFEEVFASRKKQADDFYDAIIPATTPTDLKKIQRQAFAGLLFSKQFYYYDVERWLNSSDGLTP
ncbi:MAG: glucosidase, partial [Chitinophagaceae bacterium]